MNEALARARRPKGVHATASDQALTALYAAHYRSLVRLAALLLDEPAACEDVVQEAYVRVYRAWHRLDDHDKALAYLRQTVVNLARSALRRRLVSARLAPRPSEASPDPAYAVVERDALVRALRTLPRRQREALVLRYYADLTEAETAELMGCGTGSVKGYASRGLATLETRMETR